jgi:hypothetical protein
MNPADESSNDDDLEVVQPKKQQSKRPRPAPKSTKKPATKKEKSLKYKNLRDISDPDERATEQEHRRVVRLAKAAEKTSANPTGRHHTRAHKPDAGIAPSVDEEEMDENE